MEIGREGVEISSGFFNETLKTWWKKRWTACLRPEWNRQLVSWQIAGIGR